MKTMVEEKPRRVYTDDYFFIVGVALGGGVAPGVAANVTPGVALGGGDA